MTKKSKNPGMSDVRVVSEIVLETAFDIGLPIFAKAVITGGMVALGFTGAPAVVAGGIAAAQFGD